jgi:hypothetical protein
MSDSSAVVVSGGGAGGGAVSVPPSAAPLLCLPVGLYSRGSSACPTEEGFGAPAPVLMLIDQPCPEQLVAEADCGVDLVALRNAVFIALVTDDCPAALSAIDVVAAAVSPEVARSHTAARRAIRFMWKEVIAAVAQTRTFDMPSLGAWTALLQLAPLPDDHTLGTAAHWPAEILRLRAAVRGFFDASVVAHNYTSRLVAQAMKPLDEKQRALSAAQRTLIAPVRAAMQGYLRRPDAPRIIADHTACVRDVDPSAADANLRGIKVVAAPLLASKIHALCSNVAWALQALLAADDSLTGAAADAPATGQFALYESARMHTDTAIFDAAVLVEAARLWPSGLPKIARSPPHGPAEPDDSDSDSDSTRHQQEASEDDDEPERPDPTEQAAATEDVTGAARAPSAAPAPRQKRQQHPSLSMLPDPRDAAAEREHTDALQDMIADLARRLVRFSSAETRRRDLAHMYDLGDDALEDLCRIANFLVREVRAAPVPHGSRHPGVLFWARLMLFTRHSEILMLPFLVGAELETRSLLCPSSRALLAMAAVDMLLARLHDRQHNAPDVKLRAALSLATAHATTAQPAPEPAAAPRHPMAAGTLSYGRHILLSRDRCIHSDQILYAQHAFFPLKLPNLGADPTLYEDVVPFAFSPRGSNLLYASAHLAAAAFAAGFRAARNTSRPHRVALVARLAGTLDGWLIGHAFRAAGATVPRACRLDMLHESLGFRQNFCSSDVRELPRPPRYQSRLIERRWSVLQFQEGAERQSLYAALLQATPAQQHDQTSEHATAPQASVVPSIRHAIVPIALLQTRKPAIAVTYAVLQLPKLRHTRDRLMWRVGLPFEWTREALVWLVREQWIQELLDGKICFVPRHLAVPVKDHVPIPDPAIVLPLEIVMLAAEDIDAFWIYAWLAVLGAANQAGLRLSVRRLTARTCLEREVILEKLCGLVKLGWLEVEQQHQATSPPDALPGQDDVWPLNDDLLGVKHVQPPPKPLVRLLETRRDQQHEPMITALLRDHRRAREDAPRPVHSESPGTAATESPKSATAPRTRQAAVTQNTASRSRSTMPSVVVVKGAQAEVRGLHLFVGGRLFVGSPRPELFMQDDPLGFLDIEAFWEAWIRRFGGGQHATILFHPDWLRYPFGESSVSFLRSNQTALVPSHRLAAVEEFGPADVPKSSPSRPYHAKAVPVLCAEEEQHRAAAVIASVQRVWLVPKWAEHMRPTELCVPGSRAIYLPVLPPSSTSLLRSHAVVHETFRALADRFATTRPLIQELAAYWVMAVALPMKKVATVLGPKQFAPCARITHYMAACIVHSWARRQGVVEDLIEFLPFERVSAATRCVFPVAAWADRSTGEPISMKEELERVVADVLALEMPPMVAEHLHIDAVFATTCIVESARALKKTVLAMLDEPLNP